MGGKGSIETITLERRIPRENSYKNAKKFPGVAEMQKMRQTMDRQEIADRLRVTLRTIDGWVRKYNLGPEPDKELRARRRQAERLEAERVARNSQVDWFAFMQEWAKKRIDKKSRKK